MTKPTTTSPREPGRLARWAPTLLGLAFAGVGVGALGIASQKLTIVIAPPQGPTKGADPIALLRDDVSSLQESLASLSKDLGNNLEALALHLDDGARQSEANLREHLTRLQAQLKALQATQAARANTQRSELRAVEHSIRHALEQSALTIRLAAGSTSAGSVATDSSAESAGSDSAGVLPDISAPAPAEPAPAPDEPTEPAPAPVRTPAPAPAPKRGLFSFKSTGGLDFKVRQRFTVIASLSRVGFDGKSTLHDFSGATSEVEGFIVTTLATPSEGSSGEIKARAASLTTGLDGRDKDMWGLLETGRHPDLTFAFESFVADAVDEANKTVRGTAKGGLTLRGVSRTVAMPVSLKVDASKRLGIEGEVSVKLTDFGIEPPSTAGAITMDDSIRVWIALRLRSLGPAGGE